MSSNANELFEASRATLESWSEGNYCRSFSDNGDTLDNKFKKPSLSAGGVRWSKAPKKDVALLEEYVFKNIQKLPTQARMFKVRPKGSFKFLLDLVPGDLVTFELSPDNDLRERYFLLVGKNGTCDSRYRIFLDDFSDDWLGFLDSVFPFLEAYVDDVIVRVDAFGPALDLTIRFEFASLDVDALVSRIWRLARDPWIEWYEQENNRTISNGDAS